MTYKYIDSPVPGQGGYGRVKLWDGNQEAEVDVAGVLVTITTGHYKTHAGELWVVSDENGDLDTNEWHTWIARTPVDKSVHLSFNIDLDGKGKVELFESASYTGTASGSQITSFNANRASTATDSVLWFESASLGASGSRLEVHHLGTSGGPVSPGSGGEQKGFLEEWVLKPSTDYVFKITSEASSVHIAASFQYYCI